MHRFAVILSILVVLGLWVPGSAWGQGGPSGRRTMADSIRGPGMRMMQGRMMEGGMIQMMQRRVARRPLHRATMTGFLLPALADTLNLSDEQLHRIRQLRSASMAQQRSHRDEMQDRRGELSRLFDADEHPSAETVREHMRMMAALRANHRASMYETAQQMRQVLTAEQRGMVDGLPPRHLVRLTMAHMPMLDVMRLMRSMRGGGARPCPMGGRGWHRGRRGGM